MAAEPRRVRPRRATSQAAGVDAFSRLGDVEVEKILSFLLAALQDLPAVARMDSRFAESGRRLGSWEGAIVVVPRKVLDVTRRRDALLKISMTSWNLASEVRLAAHNCRAEVASRLKLAWPQLNVTVQGDGPYSLFCMQSMRRFTVGENTGLHFFEPRYVWMVRKMLSAGIAPDRPSDIAPDSRTFGWVTDFMGNETERGVLCEVTVVQEVGNSVNVNFRIASHFTMLESWAELVPGRPSAPPLRMGYVQLEDPDSVTEGVLIQDLEEALEAAEEEYLSEDDQPLP